MLNKPLQLNNCNWSKEYNREEVDNFISQLNFETGNIQGKSIYLEDNTISQSKLREAGFTIKRDKSKADLIVISDFRRKSNSVYYNTNKKYVFDYGTNPSEIFDEFIAEEALGYKYIFDHEIYKYIYKYTGDQVLFHNISDLLASKNSDNTKLAMEMIANANWLGNEIYLQELFNLHWYNNMISNKYKNSISFKGLLSSLSFRPGVDTMSCASKYRDLCKTDEHHEFVYKKYQGEFERRLEDLFEEYKIKIGKLEYSIDKEKLLDEEA